MLELQQLHKRYGIRRAHPSRCAEPTKEGCVVTDHRGHPPARPLRLFDRVMDPLHRRKPGALEARWDRRGGASRWERWELCHPRLAAVIAALAYAAALTAGLAAGVLAWSVVSDGRFELEPVLLAVPALVLVLQLRPLHRAALDAARRYAAWQHTEGARSAGAAAAAPAGADRAG